MSSTDHSGSDAPDETSIRRKIFRKHVFNHQRRDLKTEFSEYQEQAGSGERRADLERYVLVALAIGRSPHDPPQWALDECEKLYVQDASHQSSLTKRVKSFEPDEALLDLVINILEAHPDNLAAFYSQNEDGGEFLPEDAKLSFKKHVPGPATEQKHPKEDKERDDQSKAEDEEGDDKPTVQDEEGDDQSKAEDEESNDPFKGLVDARLSTTAAMRDVLSSSGEPVLHDDARLKLLQRRWRQTSRKDKQALLWRAFHIAQFRRSGHVPRFRYSD